MKIHKVILPFVLAALLLTVGIAIAASTTKSLSTNYTLVNLGTSTANVVANYYKEDGSSWPASSSTYTLTANGGQAIIAQYFDSTMTSGKGSAVVSADQPLGAVVQILARNQVPTSGAYIASSETDSTYYLPLALRRVGGSNSQIIVQNADTGSVTVSIQLIKSAASPGANYTKSGIVIQQGASFYYDLDDEASANVADGWFGSVVVTAASSKKINVVSNIFAGADELRTYNGFPSTKLGTTWFIPLFTSRLSNGLSTPVAVQNLSGGTFAIGTIGMTCTKDAASGGTDFTINNTTAVAANESYFFNPVTDTSIQANWFGACKITAPGNVVSFVQMRQPGVSANSAAYEAISGSGTNTKVIVPLAAKRLANGFATPITIQNLSASTVATVTLTYTPSPSYSGSQSPVVVTGLTIPAGGSLIRNLRLASGSGSETALPDGWFGSLTVQSTNGVALDGFVQLTTLGAISGDTQMAHGVFTLP
jgi:hypothetical protein